MKLRIGFLKSFGRAIDLSGAYKNKKKYGDDRDADMLKGDWINVGKDISRAIKRYKAPEGSR